MPKTSDTGGASYMGYEGIVEHAGGRGSTREGGISQLDPSRDVDGSVRDGFESEEREIEDVDPRLEGARPAVDDRPYSADEVAENEKPRDETQTDSEGEAGQEKPAGEQTGYEEETVVAAAPRRTRRK